MAQSSNQTNIIDFVDEKTKEIKETENIIEFGEQLKRAREAKGMTQQTLAEQLFVTRQAVSRWEHGDRYPDLLTTKKISTILDVSLDELLSEKEMKNVVERNPVFERPLINNLIIAFYAVIVVTYVPPIVFMLVETLSGRMQMEGDNLIAIISHGIVILVFTYGFFCAIREALSPKRVGFISVIFFMATIVGAVDELHGNIASCHIRHIPSDTMYIVRVILLGIIPSVIGAVASYLFFIKRKIDMLFSILIILSAVLGIANACVEWIRQFVDILSYDLTNLFPLLSNLLIYSCTYVLIVCQMHMVKRKRALVSNEQKI